MSRAFAVLPVVCVLALAACGGGDRPPRPGRVEIVPPRVTLPVADQQVFAATPPNVTWSVREGAVGGTIDASGLYTASGETGTYTVVALETGSGVTGEAVVTVVAANAVQTHGLHVPPTHPRLWFDGPRLARARAHYAANPFAPSSGAEEVLALQRAARGLLNAGDPADQRVQCRAALDWAMARTAAMAASIADTASQRDAARWNGEAIIASFDWCHPHLTPAEEAAFVADTNAWVRFWPEQPYGGVPMYQNNYYWGFVRNQIMWAIASYEDNTAVAEALLDDALVARLENNFHPLAAHPQIGRGGVVQEGTQYGPYLVGYSVIPFATASLLGRDLREESNFWKEAVYGFVYSTTLQPTAGAYRMFPHSDIGSEANYRVTADVGNYMTDAAMRWSGLGVGRHARQWLGVTGASRGRHVEAVDPGGAALPFSGLPLDYYAPGIRWLYGRSSWEPGATAFFLQMGDRPTGIDFIGHGHVDWGSWQLWRGGQFVSRETAAYFSNASHRVAGWAGGTAVDSGQAVAHNALLVDGQGAATSDHLRVMEGAAAVTRLESRPGWAFAAVDLGTTLRNPAWVAWVREYVFVRDLETLVVLDRVESATPGATKTFLAHCETAPAIGAGTATCTVGAQSLAMTTLSPAGAAYRTVAEGGTMGQQRIEVDTTPGTARSHVLTVLQAKDAAAPRRVPTLVEDATSYTVTLAPGTTLTFLKGITSSGGSITHGGQTTPLRADAQLMDVTDDGPVWR
jgi:hypothetical protein